MEQPFGYTGYRYDEVGGTYFAQAREYQSKSGRFMAEDVIKGNGAAPNTLHQYNYCLDNSLSYVDWDGKSVTGAILVVAGLALLLTGCGAAEDEVVKPVIKPLPSPTPTPQPTPTPVPQPTPQAVLEEYIKVEDYNVSERKEFIEFMKYAESGGNYNGELHDVDGDGKPETIVYGHDVNGNSDINMYIGKTLSEKEGEKLLIQDLEKRIPIDWLKDMENAGHQFKATEIDALLSLVFAVGEDWANEIKSPTLTNMIKTGNYTNQQIYDQFLTYDSKNNNLTGLQKDMLQKQGYLFLVRMI